jgi:hypothetical protein
MHFIYLRKKGEFRIAGYVVGGGKDRVLYNNNKWTEKENLSSTDLLKAYETNKWPPQKTRNKRKNKSNRNG